jgi:hypothetical protein
MKIMPHAAFYFEGSNAVFKIAAQIIAKKSESIGETYFY